MATSKLPFFKIRPVIYNDLEKIFEIELLVFKKDAYPFSFLSLLYYLNRATFFVAVDNKNEDEVHGYILSNISWKERLGHIISFAVKPSSQRKGVGTALLNKLESILKRLNMRKIILEVRISNIDAISLYEREGFKRKTISPNYYEDGEAALVMIKQIF
ncbi:MAG: ribosomal protein S18-alanine N-acetyltransferase [Candidatus Wukongarchaeota archaeon]|nr:ribosomal protein S18-alanine N-acetyltransferase [Candidatus Wukongarchaeota archaeon]